MLEVEQILFGLPHIARTAPPIGTAVVEARELVGRQLSAVVDVWIKIAPGQIANAAENRRSPVQAFFPRSADRSPAAVFAKNVNDVIQSVLAFKTCDERWMSMTFKNRGSDERCFKAMDRFSTNG